jgi:hypothetical protein
LRVIVVADFREIALLPLAAIDERDLIGPEFHQRIGLGEIRNDRVRVLLGIAHHVGHARFRPALIGGFVAALAFGRPDIMRARNRFGLCDDGRLR